MKYKVIKDFVMNGLPYKEGQVVELDHLHASLKSIQKNIVKVEKEAPAETPKPVASEPAKAPVAPETPPVAPVQTTTQPETAPIAPVVAPGEQNAPTGKVGQTTPETPPQA